ncbi:MAG: autotransporter-associated beta strand repeat-containing protein [Verrucomicrobiae bacterium]|nr:autotransporter-associated beta strand repeat-containing protein [Verrucomicrobiae bacterium]MCP5532302.1 autotransporter-associated beta strand repeat-containing protein [Akkermansiaceae bacterium]
MDALDVESTLDLNGTAVTANLEDSSGNFTTSGANATLTANNYLDGVLDGIVSDNGEGSRLQFVKTGNASVTLNGANTYSGGTTLSGGTLVAGDNSAFGSGTLAITNGTAILDLNGATVGNPLTNSGTGAQITNSSATEATVTSGFNFANAAGVVISDFTVNGTGDIRWDGGIKRTSGTGTMTKSGTNTLTINEANGIAPIGGMNLAVSDGILFLGRTTAQSFADLTINGGTLKMDPNYQVSAGANIWQGTFSNVAVMNGGVWDLNDTGTNGISNRVKRITGTGGTITNSGTGASLLVLAARDTANPVWAGNIQDGTGTVALTIQYGGSVNQVMQFSGAHTYSGDTNIRENVMQAGAANVFSPNSNFVIPNHNFGGKLDLNSFNNTIGSLGGDEPDAQVLLGTATLTTGGTNADTTFPGVISGTGGLTKVGAGTFTLTGTNTYTGDTTVSAGVLAVDGDALADSGKLVISGGKVAPTGTEMMGSLFFGAVQQANGTWGASGSGAAHIDDTRFAGTGVIQVGAASGFDSWADANGATGQTADQDHDNDGVDNGVEYFIGGPNGNTTGFTALPGVTTVGGVRSVTWTHAADYTGTYGPDFFVETSTTLAAGSWTTETVGGNVTIDGNNVTYTFPAGPVKNFVRLVVTPN